VFEEVLGIPAHPLLVHAAVVFVPLQVLAAFVYALVPVVRRLIAWLVVGLAVLAPITAFMAKLAGDALRERMIRNATVTPEFLPKIDQHSSFGNSTLYASLILSVLTVGLVVVQVLRSRPRRDPDHATSGDDKATTNGATTNGAKGMMLLAVVLTVAVLSVGGATGYYVFKTGDSGAHMVWDGL
jgi:hypothetical protein